MPRSRPRPQPGPARPTPLSSPEVQFVPDRRYTALAAGGALGALAALLATDDRAGRLLFGVGIAVLLAYVACDLIFSPRVVASSTGVVLNSPFTRASLDWDQVEDVRAETRFRRGLRSTTLEIDAGPVLGVFTKRTLGVEPLEAATQIEALRPR